MFRFAVWANVDKYGKNGDYDYTEYCPVAEFTIEAGTSEDVVKSAIKTMNGRNIQILTITESGFNRFKEVAEKEGFSVQFGALEKWQKYDIITCFDGMGMIWEINELKKLMERQMTELNNLWEDCDYID